MIDHHGPEAPNRLEVLVGAVMANESSKCAAAVLVVLRLAAHTFMKVKACLLERVFQMQILNLLTGVSLFGVPAQHDGESQRIQLAAIIFELLSVAFILVNFLLIRGHDDMGQINDNLVVILVEHAHFIDVLLIFSDDAFFVHEGEYRDAAHLSDCVVGLVAAILHIPPELGDSLPELFKRRAPRLGRLCRLHYFLSLL
jgi:hypothetical protein